MKKRIFEMCIAVAILFVPLTFSGIEKIKLPTQVPSVISYIFDPGW
ncbi:hypothetical protein [Brevibacillus gelatini]|nr:hypothetical protein [Brevibacillus gelatini]